MSETTPRGLPMTTWLLIFCIFNLVVTLALCGSMFRRSHMMMGGYMQNGNQMMMQRGGNQQTRGYARPGMMMNKIQSDPATATDASATVPAQSTGTAQ